MNRYEIKTGKAKSFPHFAHSIAEIAAGIEKGQRVKLTKITEAIYETDRGQRFTITAY